MSIYVPKQHQPTHLRPLKESHIKKANSAFTLVELMVVVVIVGILSAIALPNFLKQTDKAKATEAKQNIASTLKQAQAQFGDELDFVLPGQTAGATGPSKIVQVDGTALREHSAGATTGE